MRLLSSRARSERRTVLDERGVTVLEMMIVVALFSLALVTLIGALDRSTTSATFAQRRNESLDDLRLMAGVFAKDVRQGIAATTASPTQFSFITYVDGTERDVTWRSLTTVDGNRLERIIDGGVAQVFVVDLTIPEVFSYIDGAEADPTRVNRVRMSLYTRPDERFAEVGLTTEVEMRNVD